MAIRILNKASSESGPEFILPKMDSDAKPLMDTNVTRKEVTIILEGRAKTVESGNEEIGSSMQRIASNLLSVEVASGTINKGEATTTEFPSDSLHMVAV